MRFWRESQATLYRSLFLTFTGLFMLANDGARPSDSLFLDQTHQAMDKMMDGMAVQATGDADVDFASMMIPHHQGAIDMAVAELRFGHDEQLRRVAQEILVDQQQEIMVMRMALDRTDAGRETHTPVAPAMKGMNMGEQR